MSQPIIHPTAIVAEGAKLGADVNIGPYCIIGPHVTIGAGTTLQSHVVIQGHTTLGEGNKIYPFASLGQDSPDRKYKGEVATLVIGDHNDIREYVTMHIGTGDDRSETIVGSHNLFMALSHIAHDCQVGDRCIFANGAHLAGHVQVEDAVIIGGLSGVRQRVRIGAHAIIGGHSGVDKDVPPYANVAGKRARLGGLNLVGLRRQGMDRQVIKALQHAYDVLFTPQETAFADRITALAAIADQPEVLDLLAFVQESQRGLTQPEADA